MGTRQTDTVQVRCDSGPHGRVPTQFLWSDRLYLVCGVVAHRTEAGAAQSWRVVAARGRAFAAGIYDLRLEADRGEWQLSPVAG